MNPEFIKMMEAMGGAFAELPAVLSSTLPEVSVRVNHAKGGDVPEGADRVPWCADGYYLAGRPRFTFDPALHQGLYYVQDASSMAQVAAVNRAVEIVGSTGAPLRYLDACAAPGGKTTAAMSALPTDALVVANEFDPRRTSILAENLAKWGAPAIITRGDAAMISGLDGFFDIISADVPCSGEGMMRKDPQAVSQWSPALVTECAARQRLIVDNLWRSLRPGGVMIYSTCTFNPDENERIVANLISNHDALPLEIPALSYPEITGALDGFAFPAYRFLPGKIRGEGLFMAMLRKPGNQAPAMPRLKSKSKITKHASIPNCLQGDWTYTPCADGDIYALPSALLPLADAVTRSCKVISNGIHVGEIKGHDIVPAQPLAMAQTLRRDIFPEAEIDRDTAISYLRREAITLPDGTPRGIILLTHASHPLGFVKNLGSRANNLYPTPWRILSQK